MAVVEMESVSKRFGGTLALCGVSMSLPTGRVIGLLGHNGAGKSTLIKLILGLIRASAGTLLVFGRPPSGPKARSVRERVAYLPENVTFYDNLTGCEIIAYLASLKRVPKKSALALLDKTGLGDAGDRRVRTYSKGMRQRLGLAQALLGSPELLLLDEPTTGLDPMATLDFYRLVRELRGEGRTLVISSHLLGELEPHLDYAVILGHGQVLAHGTMAELREDAALPVTITVRLADTTEGLTQQPWLTRLGVAVRSQQASLIELEVPRQHKMEVMRILMDRATLTDINVREPTLARLYAHMDASGGQGDTSCTRS